jgi:hypothetical protein
MKGQLSYSFYPLEGTKKDLKEIYALAQLVHEYRKKSCGDSHFNQQLYESLLSKFSEEDFVTSLLQELQLDNLLMGRVHFYSEYNDSNPRITLMSYPSPIMVIRSDKNEQGGG